MTPRDLTPIDRRGAIKWMIAAAGTITFWHQTGFAAEGSIAGRGPAAGYGMDPDLTRDYHPGELWPLTFTDAQNQLAQTLCEVILPTDAQTPGAGPLGIHRFIDEWISAPYPGHGSDQAVIVGGLDWLAGESQRRFGNDFSDLILSQQRRICDDICYLPKAAPQFRKAAAFFKRYRDLTAGGYYTTPEGMKSIGYVGNVPMATFAGPPPEALERLGLSPEP
jgi:hypothetical protein